MGRFAVFHLALSTNRRKLFVLGAVDGLWCVADDCRLLAAFGVCPLASALLDCDHDCESVRLRCLATRPRLPHSELHRAGCVASGDLFRLPKRLASTQPKIGRAGAGRGAMKLATLALYLLAFAGAVPSADPAFFRYERNVSVTTSDQQNYVVVNPEIWSHARPDLADLRLYDGGTQIPYVLTAQQSGRASEEQVA